jgi:hypothetical protein
MTEPPPRPEIGNFSISPGTFKINELQGLKRRRRGVFLSAANQQPTTYAMIGHEIKNARRLPHFGASSATSARLRIPASGKARFVPQPGKSGRYLQPPPYFRPNP